MIGGAVGGVEAMFFPHEGIGFWPLISMGAILGGTAVLNQIHFVIYLLAVALVVLAVRIWRGVDMPVEIAIQGEPRLPYFRPRR